MKFTLDSTTGLIAPAEFIASPNYDQRPDGTDISLIVIHGISLPPSQFGGEAITQLFTNKLDFDEDPYYQQIKDLKVSSHLLIRRDGSVIQYVPLDKRAWHAGESEFQGRMNCNDFAIGIELEGTDDIAYETEQYLSLAPLTQALIKAYPNINSERIVGHCDIAPGRKTDPGPSFDWQYYREQLAATERE